MSIIQIILAIFLPPVAVLLEKGISSAFFFNILWTILGVVPGIIHAFYILTK